MSEVLENFQLSFYYKCILLFQDEPKLFKLWQQLTDIYVDRYKRLSLESQKKFYEQIACYAFHMKRWSIQLQLAVNMQLSHF